VNSTVDLCCSSHQWPILPLQGGIEFFARAAVPALQARAAILGNFRNGLSTAIRRIDLQWLVSLTYNPAPYRSGPRQALTIFGPEKGANLPQSAVMTKAHAR
jgi:hypothetical protein